MSVFTEEFLPVYSRIYLNAEAHRRGLVNDQEDERFNLFRLRAEGRCHLVSVPAETARPSATPRRVPTMACTSRWCSSPRAATGPR
jgi:hypothetical protein